MPKDDGAGDDVWYYLLKKKYSNEDGWRIYKKDNSEFPFCRENPSWTSNTGGLLVGGEKN